VLIGVLLMHEGLALYDRVRSGEVNVGRILQQLMPTFPPWLDSLLARLDLNNFAAIQERVSSGLTRGLQFVLAHAFNVGQNTFAFIVDFFIMLYLLFFFLRDGPALAGRIGQAIPLRQSLRRNLRSKFTNVIRATMKGTVVVAIVQGALGGLIFSLLGIHAAVLWGVVMSFLSLLPAVGTALVWVPVAIYLLVTGAVWKGVVLIAYGVLVIGLVDNVLRPVLVGKQTKIPDYVVLITTLGGMALFGINGFVIGPVIAAMFIAVWDIVAHSGEAR
jgi:predicted PurR-regulated permease PerM